jgi:phage-related tail fiber protein
VEFTDTIRLKGEVELLKTWKNGKEERIIFPNAILQKGREALAASLANEYGTNYDFFITRMLFGDGGTSADGQPRHVDSHRNGLFGTTVVNKPVISTIDPNNASQVVFTSVITYDEGNGYVLNEMALQMNTGDLYSMTTFGGVTKSSIMQMTWTWRLSFV